MSLCRRRPFPLPRVSRVIWIASNPGVSNSDEMEVHIPKKKCPLAADWWEKSLHAYICLKFLILSVLWDKRGPHICTWQATFGPHVWDPCSNPIDSTLGAYFFLGQIDWRAKQKQERAWSAKTNLTKMMTINITLQLNEVCILGSISPTFYVQLLRM